MKKHTNVIFGVVGSIAMIFGVLFFLSFMQDDDKPVQPDKGDQLSRDDGKKDETEQTSEEQVAEQKAKEEQAAKEKAVAEQKAKEEQATKEKAVAEQKAKEEQATKEKAVAEQKAKEEQAAKEKAVAEPKKPSQTQSNAPNKASTPNNTNKKPEIKPNPKDDIPSPDEDYDEYLEYIGVDMNPPMEETDIRDTSKPNVDIDSEDLVR